MSIIEQNHKAYPHITKLTLDMVGYNGGLHCLRTPEIGAEQDVKNKLDECLGAEGVYAKDLDNLDKWLASLSDEDFFVVADGEETAVAILLEKAPPIGDAEDTAADFINSIYEHCI